MKLVIVESPTKANTIEKFLGKDYRVLSSYGHIRDLPKSKLGIDTEKDFEPSYVIPTKARKAANALKKESKKADATILATDEDREGEAISYHLKEVLELKDPKRIVFHEITKSAIEEALQNPRDIDMNLVDAQQARRILDRLVGYKLSPFLWKKVTRGLSAGRVQSVAVRLVVDREREIQAFIAEEYWSIEAELKKGKDSFIAQLTKKDGKTIEKLEIKNQDQANTILKELAGAQYIVTQVERKETNRNPSPPFTTSTLQQTSSQRLRYSARQTMQLAQQLYERGYITYHRTDSLNLSAFALGKAQDFITETYGKKYWAGKARVFKTKSKGAQEAHEAIRPAYPDTTPEQLQKKLTPQQFRLYDLIWRRFMASQMSQATFDSISADIAAASYAFRASGQTLKFDGFLKVYPVKFEETTLPLLEERDVLDLQQLTPNQHFTQPPPRYSEATLIKVLEERGVGRPSTYAPIISTIQDRGYVERNEQKRFQPTELGITVNDILVEHFPQIVDIDFTARMEEELDEIAEGQLKWTPMIKDFYEPFSKNLEKKYEEVKEKKMTEETDKKCPECGSPVVIRIGRYGKFYACSTFPECKYTESLENANGDMPNIPCPKCGKGKIVPKRTKRKKIFYGCNRYPECDFALWQKPTGEHCTACRSLLIEGARKKIVCSNKECKLEKVK